MVSEGPRSQWRKILAIAIAHEAHRFHDEYFICVWLQSTVQRDHEEGSNRDELLNSIETWVHENNNYIFFVFSNTFSKSFPDCFHCFFCNLQLDNCFLACINKGTIEGIYDGLKEWAVISKPAGGIWVDVHYIVLLGVNTNGTNGTLNGIAVCSNQWHCRYVESWQWGSQKKGHGLVSVLV